MGIAGWMLIVIGLIIIVSQAFAGLSYNPISLICGFLITIIGVAILGAAYRRR